MACSVLNRFCARVLASSVLPTPVGPRKRKLAMGPLGSFMPALQVQDDSRADVQRTVYRNLFGALETATGATQKQSEAQSVLRKGSGSCQATGASA